MKLEWSLSELTLLGKCGPEIAKRDELKSLVFK
jgi:hypothetical protein